MIANLPSRARRKLAELQDAADHSRAVLNNTLAKIAELDRVLGPDPHHPDAGERRAERQRLGENMLVQQERARNYADLIGSVVRFVDQIGNVPIGMAAPIKARTARGDLPLKEAIASLRKKINTTRTEIVRVSAAALPLTEQQDAARRYLADLAKQGAPSIKVAHDVFEVTRQSSWAVAANNIFPILAWLNPNQFADSLCRDLEKRPAPALALSADDKAAQLAKLNTECLRLEREEETLIVAAEEDGLHVPRRTDADPRAVLEITINEKAAAAVA